MIKLGVEWLKIRVSDYNKVKMIKLGDKWSN